MVDVPPPQEGQLSTLPDVPIKMKCIHHPPSRSVLHHPCSLKVLPSSTNKWSETTHPIKAAVCGYYNTTISYMHYYFHDGQVLLTQAFAASKPPPLVTEDIHAAAPNWTRKLDIIAG
jgi:hypothetical protein